MLAFRAFSEVKQGKPAQFADAARLFAVQPVRTELVRCSEFACESLSELGCLGLNGVPNPDPLRR